MTQEEANKIIAEYMGVPEDSIGYSWSNYSKSLDALVPVWEKMRALQVNVQWAIKSHTVFISSLHGNWQRGDSLDIKQAAAIATARAIKELKK